MYKSSRHIVSPVSPSDSSSIINTNIVFSSSPHYLPAKEVPRAFCFQAFIVTISET